jgi:hypothetical protein
LEHWVHLKTSNPIESTFSLVRARTRITKGAGSRTAGLAMAFKLIEAASEHWRSVNGPPFSSRSYAPGQSSDRGSWSSASRSFRKPPRESAGRHPQHLTIAPDAPH